MAFVNMVTIAQDKVIAIPENNVVRKCNMSRFKWKRNMTFFKLKKYELLEKLLDPAVGCCVTAYLNHIHHCYDPWVPVIITEV